MYVYILTTQNQPYQYYIGITSNLKARLAEHNRGKNPHTSQQRPWVLKNAFWFKDKEKAHTFEKYLKTNSGRAFAIKHF